MIARERQSRERIDDRRGELEKSPRRSAGFGTVARNVRPCVERRPSYPPNAKTLFRRSGPPEVTPYWLRSNGVLVAAK